MTPTNQFIPPKIDLFAITSLFSPESHITLEPVPYCCTASTAQPSTNLRHDPYPALYRMKLTKFTEQK